MTVLLSLEQNAFTQVFILVLNWLFKKLFTYYYIFLNTQIYINLNIHIYILYS